MVIKPDQGPRRCRPWAVCYECRRLGRMGDGAVWGCFGVGAEVESESSFTITVHAMLGAVRAEEIKISGEGRGTMERSDMAESEREREPEMKGGCG